MAGIALALALEPRLWAVRSPWASRQVGRATVGGYAADWALDGTAVTPLVDDFEPGPGPGPEKGRRGLATNE